MVEIQNEINSVNNNRNEFTGAIFQSMNFILSRNSSLKIKQFFI